MRNFKIKNWKSWIKDTYRLVLMNDSTFEEKISFRLSPLSFFIFIGAITITIIILVISLVAFTPLREYIPGYADVHLRKRVLTLALKADSLEQDVVSKDLYISNINNIISGNIPRQNYKDQKSDTGRFVEKVDLKPSENDIALRTQIESQEQYALSSTEAALSKSGISSFFFFSPIKGMVSGSFNILEGHFGVDVVAPENEAIKATLDGTVLFAGWTSETGNVIQLQHANNLVSIYKHNSALMKKPGQYVKAGEVIGIIGNSGEHTSGPHLHFELWHNGTPVNPQEYMVF